MVTEPRKLTDIKMEFEETLHRVISDFENKNDLTITEIDLIRPGTVAARPRLDRVRIRAEVVTE